MAGSTSELVLGKSVIAVCCWALVLVGSHGCWCTWQSVLNGVEKARLW
jgi:hypothetical protein